VSTIEELLGRKRSGSGLESREYSRRNPSSSPRGTLYPKVGSNFADKLRSLGAYSCLAASPSVATNSLMTGHKLGTVPQTATDLRRQCYRLNLAYIAASSTVLKIIVHVNCDIVQSCRCIQNVEHAASIFRVISLHDQAVPMLALISVFRTPRSQISVSKAAILTEFSSVPTATFRRMPQEM
jgi:hypothetical protein